MKTFTRWMCMVVCVIALAFCASAQNSGVLPGVDKALANVSIRHLDRTVLGEDVVHYRFDVRVGPGQFDVIRLHRIVREHNPYRPIETVTGVMLLPGSPNYFESIFMEPLISQVPPWDRSIAVFLAKNNVDVWGMDYAWALVPAETTDFNFMKGWGVTKDVRHTESAITLARLIRASSGQGPGQLNVLGFSYGGVIAYALAGEETQKPRIGRNVKGLIPTDMPMKFKEKFVRDYYCSLAAVDQANLDAGVYNDDSGLFFGQVGELALSAPSDPSPIFPGMSNFEAALWGAASTWMLTGSPIYWHFNAGAGNNFSDPNWIADNLRYTEPRLSLDLDVALPPHLPMQTDFDVDGVLCGAIKLPFDDHLSEIDLPILYVGAGGGFGTYGYYTTRLTASRDVTKFTVQFETPDRRMFDFAHADLFMAGNAETQVWKPILDWLSAHR